MAVGLYENGTHFELRKTKLTFMGIFAPKGRYPIIFQNFHLLFYPLSIDKMSFGRIIF